MPLFLLDTGFPNRRCRLNCEPSIPESKGSGCRSQGVRRLWMRIGAIPYVPVSPLRGALSDLGVLRRHSVCAVRDHDVGAEYCASTHWGCLRHSREMTLLCSPEVTSTRKQVWVASRKVAFRHRANARQLVAHPRVDWFSSGSVSGTPYVLPFRRLLDRVGGNGQPLVKRGIAGQHLCLAWRDQPVGRDGHGRQHAISEVARRH